MMVVVVFVLATTASANAATPGGHDQTILDSTVRFLRSGSLGLLALNRSGQWRIQLGHSLPDFHPLILGWSFLLFLVPSDRWIHLTTNKTVRFRTLRALGLGLWACLLLLKLLAGSKDRTNNSLTSSILSSGLSSHFFFKLTTDQPPKMHLSAVIPHPTQQRWWLVDRVDFRPLLQMMKHHTLQYTFVVAVAVVLLFNFDCFRIVSGDFTHTSIALRGSVFFYFFFLFRWLYASSRYLRRGLSPKKKTAAHHTLKWSASSNVHYSTPPLVRS